MTTVVTLFSEHIDEPSEKLARGIEKRKVPWSQLCDFADVVREYNRSQRIPQPARGVLRPYLPGRGAGSALYTGGVNLDHRTFHRGADEALSCIDALKTHLLYCHALAVDDPLIYFVDLMFPRDDRAEVRTAIANYVRFLAAVRGLVDTQTLILVEPYFWDILSLREPSQGPPPGALAQRSYTWDLEVRSQRAIAREDLTELTTALGRELDDKTRRALVKAIGDAIPMSLAAAEYHHLDLYVPFRFFLAGYAALSPSIPALPPLRPQELVSALVPSLDGLSLDDVLAVRRQDEVFEQWRSALERAADRIKDTFDPLSPDRNAQALVQARAELQNGRQLVEQRVQQSSVLGQARQGAKDLTLGALAACALAPLGKEVSAGAIGASAVKTAGGVMWQYAKYRGSEAQRDRALLHHFLLFKPSTYGGPAAARVRWGSGRRLGRSKG